MQVDAVQVRCHATALTNIRSHGTAHLVTRSQVLGCGSVSCHDGFTLAVSQGAAFSSVALRQEATSMENTCRMEQQELKIYPCRVAMPPPSPEQVCAGRLREKAPAVCTDSQDREVSSKEVNWNRPQCELRCTSGTFPPHPHEIQRHKEEAIARQRHAEKGVQYGVSNAICGSGAPVPFQN